MQNDSNVEITQAEIPNKEYVLTIETHEGVKLSHPLNIDEVRMFGKFAISMTPRKNILKNFFNSVQNQPTEKFLHIQKWVEKILAESKTKFFTVQIEKEQEARKEQGYV